MGDEGCPSTPGKADLVRRLLRVTESISDRDINNCGFAGEWSQINHWQARFAEARLARLARSSSPEISLSSLGCKRDFFSIILYYGY